VVTVPIGEDTQEEGNKAEGEDDEDYTLWSDTKKDEMFLNTDEIRTFGDEFPIPIGRLRDLLNRINITTPLEFRIKRISRPGREEYKAIMDIISGPTCSAITRVQPSGPLTRMQ
jgi:hypothetical protein